MVEGTELEYYPSDLRVETTATGVQDTAQYPTVAAHLPETSNTAFFDPTTSITALQDKGRALLAKKGAKMALGREKLLIKSANSNTLLLKQDAPMLRTNGGVAARTRYTDEAGAIAIVPSRQATDRIPFGFARFKIHYRFAGVIVPGLVL